MQIEQENPNIKIRDEELTEEEENIINEFLNRFILVSKNSETIGINLMLAERSLPDKLVFL